MSITNGWRIESWTCSKNRICFDPGQACVRGRESEPEHGLVGKPDVRRTQGGRMEGVNMWFRKKESENPPLYEMTDEDVSALKLQVSSFHAQKIALRERFRKSLKRLIEISAPVHVVLTTKNGYAFAYKGNYEEEDGRPIKPTVQVRRENFSAFLDINQVLWNTELMVTFLSSEERLIRLIKKEMEAKRKEIQVFFWTIRKMSHE